MTRKTKAKQPKVLAKYMKKKLAIVFMVIVILLFGLNIRLAYINYKDSNAYAITVLGQQQYVTTMIPFRRGDILDRSGNVLATSVQVYNLVLDPYIMLSKSDYLEPTINALIQCFPQLEESDIREIISENKNSRYIVKLKQLTYNEIKDFQAMQDEDGDIQGVWFETEYKREYPYGIVGSDVVGFVYDGNVADWGLEGYYNDELNGTEGREYGYVNSDNVQEKIVKEAVDGNTVVSTIDLQIQNVIEKRLQEYIDQYHPKNAAIVVADPHTGEILGMTCNEEYDNNNPRDLSPWYTEEELKDMSDAEMFEVLNGIWRNFCVSDSYEPGSTMKPFTVAAAYEENLVTAGTTFECDGYESVGGWTIWCWEHGGHGTLNLTESLMQSCNDALMDIGRRLGATLSEQYQNLFGFGYLTGIDLPGETEGIVTSAERMDEATLVTNAFGQNINVNMIQMVAGFSALINGGYYYQPHLVSEIRTANGAVVKQNDSILMKQVITEETSEYIRYALRETAEEGTGNRATVEGYICGGKTGTGETFDENGERSSEEYVISFIGYAANEEDYPEIVCYVLADGAQGLADPTDNGSTCTLWRNVMTDLMPIINVYSVEENGGAAGTVSTDADSGADADGDADADGAGTEG